MNILVRIIRKIEFCPHFNQINMKINAPLQSGINYNFCPGNFKIKWFHFLVSFVSTFHYLLGKKKNAKTIEHIFNVISSLSATLNFS